MEKDEICMTISRVKLEDEAEHERNIKYLAQEDDNYKSPWKEDAAGLKPLRSQVIWAKLPLKSLQQEKSQSQILKL